MGNKRITKPKKISLDLEIERYLEQVGWLKFIKMYEGFELGTIEEFVKKIHVNFTRVVGEVIEVTPKVISEILGFLAKGDVGS